MNWKKKKLYEMTVPELLKKRKEEQFLGVFFCIFAFLFLAFGAVNYYSDGLVGLLVIRCTFGIFTLVTCMLEIFIIQQINMYVYLKEHEK